MSSKILGIDLGTNSIGIALRDMDRGENLQDQLEYFSSDIFQAGKKGPNQQESYASERTSHRQSRRLKDTHRRKLWATLSLLIEYEMCPMKKESLKKWSTYNKSLGLRREYPVDDKEFNSWIALDFNRDGQPDYSSPFQIRREITKRQLDLDSREDREILGRALYHIAQHRGFRSSKGETLAEAEALTDRNEMEAEPDEKTADVMAGMQESETKKMKDLIAYMEAKGLDTVGQAYASMEDEGIRIRNKEGYQAVRRQFMDEIRYIFEHQPGLQDAKYRDFMTRILSEKKGEGTIFYKKPLRSQKGLVGKCTLEPSKTRCPISHPDFEEFRARQVINNIKYRPSDDAQWLTLPKNLKEEIYSNLFAGKSNRSLFHFKEVREYLEKKLKLRLHNDELGRTINYKDGQTIAGCPVTYRLKMILGNDWQTASIPGTKVRLSNKGKVSHQVCYHAVDIWNVCANSEIAEKGELEAKAKSIFGFTDQQAKQFRLMYADIRQGYAMLSHKAIANINRMLRKGYIYSDAVLMAKVPDLIDMSDAEINELMVLFESIVKPKIEHQKRVRSIANRLIAKYKSYSYTNNGRFADHDYTYLLDESDIRDVEKTTVEQIGIKEWSLMSDDEQGALLKEVQELYQQFFSSRERDYFKVPHLSDGLIDLLSEKYPSLEKKVWKEKLYHPSQIDIYQFARKEQTKDGRSLLGTPNVGSIRNPTVMRTLNILRRKLNYMIEEHIIEPDDTRIVVEMTRINNDTNLRWAINRYNEERRNQNMAISNLLSEFIPQFKHKAPEEADIDKARDYFDQIGCEFYAVSHEELNEKQLTKQHEYYDMIVTKDKVSKYGFQKDVERYKLWKDQGCISIYTGKPIRFSDLFDDNLYQVEHTIPRSKSFDDSDANKTICERHYNAAVKGNKMPTELPNYDKDEVIGGVKYTAIKPRLAYWEKKVKDYEHQVELWRYKAKQSQTKDRKDFCIQRMHLWRMELDYWRNKLDRFNMTEVKPGFRNSQLVDTGIITRYATLYLKSVFKNVDVQKGTATAKYRKILGLQSVDEKKDRSNHCHHAVDAAILTVIPVAAKRERMLQLFYEIEEAESAHHDCSQKKYELSAEVADCEIGSVAGLYNFISDRILVNHITHDRTFSDTHRKEYRNGRPVRKNGKELYSGGDGVRGALSTESFYAANKYGDEIWMVKRQSIDAFKKIEELDTIVDQHLRDNIKNTIELRMKAGDSFSKAIAQPIWLTDKDGKEIKHDRNGRPLAPIRHIRCRAKAGVGFLSFEKALPLKDFIQHSSKKLVRLQNREHKQHVYTMNDSMYLCLMYEGIKKGKVDRRLRLVSLYDAAQMISIAHSRNIEQVLWNEPYYASLTDKGLTYHLSAIIKVGMRLLFWDKSPEEINQFMPQEELAKRLFVVRKFNAPSTIYVYAKHHADASENKPAHYTANQLNCLIEHRDFEITPLGTVILKEQHD